MHDSCNGEGSVYGQIPKGVSDTILRVALRSWTTTNAVACLVLYPELTVYASVITAVVAAKLCAAAIAVNANWVSVQNVLLNGEIRLFVLECSCKEVTESETVFSGLHSLGQIDGTPVYTKKKRC